MAIKLDTTYTNARAKRVNIWNEILNIEITTGSTFLVAVPENVPYLCVGITQEIIAMPRPGRGGDRFWTYMESRYGITEREIAAKDILDRFRSYANQNGARVAIRRYAAYRNQTAYFSSYDGKMWRLDGENIMQVPNGEDDVFFLDDDGGKTVEPEVGEHGILFSRLVDGLSYSPTGMGGITAEQMRMALIVWIFALAFPDLMPTKPLMILEGAPGSGKSAACQLLQLALLGDSKPMILSKNAESDFGVLLLRSPIAVFDNLDAYIDWLPDAICSYTTKGTWTKRKLFTDSEEATIKPHAFIAVASKNPASFRREDTADRCIILRLDRRDGFARLESLEAQIRADRSQIVGEYFWYVNQIVAEIRHGALDEQTTEVHRMADFAALARVVGRVVGWEPEAVVDLLSAIQGEQIAFINEEDPLVELLHKWIEYRPGGRSSVGREIGLFQLFQEMEMLANASGIQFYKNARLLSQKLRSQHVERDFIVQLLAPDGHKSYRIWRKTDARLTSIPAWEPVDPADTIAFSDPEDPTGSDDE
jgi:hypothetical protein